MIHQRSAMNVTLVLVLLLLLSSPAAGQTAQDVCTYIEGTLNISTGLKSTLCQDFQAGIARGHLQASRALQLLQEVNDRINPSNQASAENMLTTIGSIINPAKSDLPAELLIRRVFELFSREQVKGEFMNTAAQEVIVLSRLIRSVAPVYRSLGIYLEPNVSMKVIQTDAGEIELNVSRVDTVITATAVALDRFERKLDRKLDDVAGMKSEVMRELRAPSFVGAEALPALLIQYIEAHTTGNEWAPIVRQLAADRGRTS